MSTCEIAREAGIIMHLLPPHSSNIMQPVDVGIFQTLRTSYKDSIDHYMPTHGPAINKKLFPLIFVNAWKNASIRENAINGFREAGLVPLNIEMVDGTKVPTRVKTNNASIKGVRAPGRPLNKRVKNPKRNPYPGNDYIKGLKDALNHIVHNFVSDRIRPIYEKWIQEDKSCTPDPVFYIWSSLKNVIDENIKKEAQWDQANTKMHKEPDEPRCEPLSNNKNTRSYETTEDLPKRSYEINAEETAVLVPPVESNRR